jgi:hypothetical protein
MGHTSLMIHIQWHIDNAESFTIIHVTARTDHAALPSRAGEG